MTTTNRETLATNPSLPGRAAATFRAIDAIYRAPGLHWEGDGFRVAGYFPAIPDAFRKLDPFLLLDYHPAYDYSPTDRRRGVGVHPHRGFETVTLAFQGSVAHHGAGPECGGRVAELLGQIASCLSHGARSLLGGSFTHRQHGRCFVHAGARRGRHR